MDNRPLCTLWYFNTTIVYHHDSWYTPFFQDNPMTPWPTLGLPTGTSVFCPASFSLFLGQALQASADDHFLKSSKRQRITKIFSKLSNVLKYIYIYTIIYLFIVMNVYLTSSWPGRQPSHLDQPTSRIFHDSVHTARPSHTHSLFLSLSFSAPFEIFIKHIWLVVSIPLKNISQLGWLSHILWKIKHVPNHQPDSITD